MRTFKILCCLGLLGACSLATAHWQWLDKDGRKVFSDRAPPSDILEKNIIKRPHGQSATPPVAIPEGAENQGNSPATAASSTKFPGVDKALEAKKKQVAEEEAAKKRTEEDKITKAKIENCAQAKQAKATLDSGMRIGRVNAAGEREVLDEPARAAEGKRIQAALTANCN